MPKKSNQKVTRKTAIKTKKIQKIEEKEYQFDYKIPKLGIYDCKFVWTHKNKLDAKKQARKEIVDAFRDEGHNISPKNVIFKRRK